MIGIRYTILGPNNQILPPLKYKREILNTKG